MPIYEYQCSSCKKQFEEIQRFNDPVLKDCPECKQPQLQKLVSPTTFHLKGSGWYLTDSRATNQKKEAVGEKTTEAGS